MSPKKRVSAPEATEPPAHHVRGAGPLPEEALPTVGGAYVQHPDTGAIQPVQTPAQAEE